MLDSVGGGGAEDVRVGCGGALDPGRSEATMEGNGDSTICSVRRYGLLGSWRSVISGDFKSIGSFFAAT